MTEIWIGNDHGGFKMKQQILCYLKDRQIAVHDVGSYSEEIVRYPYYAAQVASAVSEGRAQRGILICSTGIGMSIIANKYPRVRASLCSSGYDGKMTRAHNDSNILCLGGKTLGIFAALDILEKWLETPFEGGRHVISLSLIEMAERTQMSGKLWAPQNEEGERCNE